MSDLVVFATPRCVNELSRIEIAVVLDIERIARLLPPHMEP
jgi:hypothetical protein